MSDQLASFIFNLTLLFVAMPLLSWWIDFVAAILSKLRRNVQ